MTSITAEAVTVAAPRDPQLDRRLVRAWLLLVALMIAGIVLVGGATRLTHSGLSITEWQPIHGVIPPLSVSDWQQEFAGYQQIPEFKILNPTMTLDQFKGIFWWEWAHRLIARLIGVVVLVPLIWLWWRGRIERGLKARIVAILLLIGAQGALGWWMVSSGLSVRTDVSQYLLAAHLTLACLIFSYTLWTARGLAPSYTPSTAPVRIGALLLVLLALLQIFMGGLVAGLDAGMSYNTWPLMDGGFLPHGYLSMQPWWRNLFENAASVQFDHRLGAYTLFAVAVIYAFFARRTPQAAGVQRVAILILLQAVLGIATLVNVVPLPLALAHQFGAVIVLAAVVTHLRAMLPPLPVRMPLGPNSADTSAADTATAPS
jgi:cytochrome c oxidase assembly protein subunit 15